MSRNWGLDKAYNNWGQLFTVDLLWNIKETGDIKSTSGLMSFGLFQSFDHFLVIWLSIYLVPCIWSTSSNRLYKIFKNYLLAGWDIPACQQSKTFLWNDLKIFLRKKTIEASKLLTFLMDPKFKKFFSQKLKCQDLNSAVFSQIRANGNMNEWTRWNKQEKWNDVGRDLINF